MKIRMQGNSIRLRLSRGEVRLFGETGRVEESVVFGPGQGNRFTYSLESGDLPTLRASFSEGRATVHVPATLGREWISTDNVGMEDVMLVQGGPPLRILVEKDFKCLSERGEDESDNFPNPNQSC